MEETGKWRWQEPAAHLERGGLSRESPGQIPLKASPEG